MEVYLFLFMNRSCDASNRGGGPRGGVLANLVATNKLL